MLQLELSSISNLIIDKVKELGGDTNATLKLDSPLIGGEAPISSMMLVELCLYLEDLALENEFDFDWTSDSAMSKSVSAFRSIETLAAEFIEQAKAQK